MRGGEQGAAGDWCMCVGDDRVGREGWRVVMM